MRKSVRATIIILKLWKVIDREVYTKKTWQHVIHVQSWIVDNVSSYTFVILFNQTIRHSHLSKLLQFCEPIPNSDLSTIFLCLVYLTSLYYSIKMNNLILFIFLNGWLYYLFCLSISMLGQRSILFEELKLHTPPNKFSRVEEVFLCKIRHCTPCF